MNLCQCASAATENKLMMMMMMMNYRLLRSIQSIASTVRVMIMPYVRGGQKIKPVYCCNNFVYYQPTFMLFGKYTAYFDATVCAWRRVFCSAIFLNFV